MTVFKEQESESSDNFKDLAKFGRFQVQQYVLICIPLCIVAISFVNYIFIAENINRRFLSFS